MEKCVNAGVLGVGWIGISSGWNRTGNGTVNYFVLSNNTGSTRTGTLTIAGQTLTVMQVGQ